MIRAQLPEKPIEIAPEQLSEATLNSLIESFVLREGTDYGLHEVSLEKKILQVRQQLDRKEIKIIFDLTSESVNLLCVQKKANQ